MVRTSSAGIAAIFKQADRTGDLHKAWIGGGRVTTFKNIQRAYKLHMMCRAALICRASLI